MRILAALFFLFGLLAGARPARAQDVNVQHPPEINPSQPSKMDALKTRLNSEQLRKDADELSALCASIPADMDAVKKGALPKDTADKLRRLEKVSKRVREELNP